VRVAVAGCAVAGWAVAGCASGVAPPRPGIGGALPAPAATHGAVVVTDAMLAEGMAQLAAGSATWRAALDTLAAENFAVLVATPEEARRVFAEAALGGAGELGAVGVLRDAGGRIAGAVVLIDVPRLRRLCLKANEPLATLQGDVQRLLIHELYGHVVPLARSRTEAGGCPDPGPGEPAASSCAIVRENRIRAEMGLEPRRSYDLSGLAIGRRLGPAVAAAGRR
jgi:hypothetical protein